MISGFEMLPRRTVATLLLALLLGLVLVGGGCKSSDRGAPKRPPRTAVRTTDDVAWPFWPASMRVHPLTRIVSDETAGETHIAARLEFFDAEGHTTKGWGRATFELHGAEREPLAEWRLDLTDPAVNQERFDDVTRMYLVPLHLDAPDSLPEDPILRAHFVSADGREFREELRVRTR